MAKHEIVIHENTGATRTSAPYVGSYISKETRRLASYAQQIADKSGLPSIQVQAILTGAFEAWEELEREALVRINTDIGQIYGYITGSFPTADAAFGEGNSLNLALRLDERIRLALADVTPTIATDESLTRLRVDNIVDVATQRPYNLIHGTNPFRIQGYNMVLTDEGAEAYFETHLGAKLPLTVDEVISKQLIRAHVTGLTEGCDGKIVLKSRGGDAEGPLQTAFRKVKYLHVAPSVTITAARQAGRPDNEIQLLTESPYVIVGENLRLGAADKLWVELYRDGERIDEGDDTGLVTGNTDTELRVSGVQVNNRTVPDGDWWDADTKIVIVKNGVRYEHPVTFKEL